MKPKIYFKLSAKVSTFFLSYFSGNPILAKVLRQKCDEFGFQFRKEVFWLNDDGEF